MRVLEDARALNVAPDRSLVQRLEALQRANRIRFYRAQLKRDLKLRRVGVADVIGAPPLEVEAMPVLDLLLAVPKVGRIKATRMLSREQISPSKTVGGLTERQRGALLSALRSS